MKLITIHSKQQASGQKPWWRVTLQTPDSKQFLLDTFDEEIATIGFEGEVETYKNGRGEKLVRQVGREGLKPTAPVDRRGQEIATQWAIGQAAHVATNTCTNPDYMDEIKYLALLFLGIRDEIIKGA